MKSERVEIYNQQSIFGGQMIRNYLLYDKVEVILLREQILLRLPQDYAKKSTYIIMNTRLIQVGSEIC